MGRVCPSWISSRYVLFASRMTRHVILSAAGRAIDVCIGNCLPTFAKAVSILSLSHETVKLQHALCPGHLAQPPSHQKCMHMWFLCCPLQHFADRCHLIWRLFSVLASNEVIVKHESHGSVFQRIAWCKLFSMLIVLCRLVCVRFIIVKPACLHAWTGPDWSAPRINRGLDFRIALRPCVLKTAGSAYCVLQLDLNVRMVSHSTLLFDTLARSCELADGPSTMLAVLTVLYI